MKLSNHALMTALLFFMLGNPAGVLADCGNLEVLANNISIDWNLNFTRLAYKFVVKRTDAVLSNDPCNFSLGFTNTSGGFLNRRLSSGASHLEYQLFKENNRNILLSDIRDTTNPNGLILDGFSDGSERERMLFYYLDIPLDKATFPNLVKAGIYEDTFNINVYGNTTNNTSPNGPDHFIPVKVNVIVNRMINLSLSEVQQDFNPQQTALNLDFGQLAEGKMKAFNMGIRSNAGYTITFTSANGGYLKLAGSNSVGQPSNSKVPYQLSVNNGPPLNLSIPDAPFGEVFQGSTGLQGHNYPARITIGSMRDRNIAGGRHEDQITITATTTQ